MNQATRQINGTDAHDILLEYMKNFYAKCVQLHARLLTEEQNNGETMAILRMDEEQFLEAISATPMPCGAKKKNRENYTATHSGAHTHATLSVASSSFFFVAMECSMRDLLEGRPIAMWSVARSLCVT